MPFNLTVNKTVSVEIDQFSFAPDRHVTIVLQTYQNGQPLLERITRVVTGSELAELLSANPSWAPTKPAGTFRLQDLTAFLQAKGL